MAAHVVLDRQNRRQLAFDLQRQELEREQAYAKELSAVVRQLENANREQAEFTYAISHDLKSPANTIGLLIEELSEVETLSEDGQSVLEDMAKTNFRMRQSVDDVLGYIKVVDGEMDTGSIDLNELIDEIRTDLRSAIQEAHAEIDICPLPMLVGCRAQVRILFQNLISNAVKFRCRDRPTRIEVTGKLVNDGVQVCVADNGIGIPKKFRDRVFGLFQRLNSQSEFEGTGLGLAICKRVISNHNGTIRVGEGIDGGARFTMQFPDSLT